jgi:hypothetical protein
MKSAFAALLLVLLAASPSTHAEEKSPFELPKAIIAKGEPIDVEHVGHAAPFVGDIDGDGRKDLLVGEFYKGRLRIYRNVGTNVEPKFDGFSLLQDGAPGGCIWAS